MKGRFLLQNWMTSLNPQGALNIHRIDHEHTILTEIGRAIIPSECGQQLSPKYLVLLSDQDAFLWSMGDGELRQLYGPRKQCKWCL